MNESGGRILVIPFLLGSVFTHCRQGWPFALVSALIQRTRRYQAVIPSSPLIFSFCSVFSLNNFYFHSTSSSLTLLFWFFQERTLMLFGIEGWPGDGLREQFLEERYYPSFLHGNLTRHIPLAHLLLLLEYTIRHQHKEWAGLLQSWSSSKNSFCFLEHF